MGVDRPCGFVIYGEEYDDGGVKDICDGKGCCTWDFADGYGVMLRASGSVGDSIVTSAGESVFEGAV